MDIIICVNHGKMNGTNIVVNATIFNDSLNEFRFRIDNNEWVYTRRIDLTNKSYDVSFDGLLYGERHVITCHVLDNEEWMYCGHIITCCNTCLELDMEQVDKKESYKYEESQIRTELCEVL